MRKSCSIIVILALLLCHAIDIRAQTTHWGTTATGGTSDVGTLYTITEASVFTKVYDFPRNPGGNPKGDLVRASNGLYYGVTEFGGSLGFGTLFSFNPATGAYVTLHEFTGNSGTATGARPIRGLVIGANGRLYGLCSEGGTNNLGTLFEYIIASATFTRKVNFNGTTNGRNPRCKLVRASNNQLYGVTALGGANNRGVLFSYNATLASTPTSVTAIYNFTLADGGQPFSGMILATNNLLYGTTQIGGANGTASNGGSLYSFNTTSNTWTKLHDFAQAGGWRPTGELVQAANGLLYGTTSLGGASDLGALFSFEIATATYTKLYDMVAGTGGNTPFGAMFRASNNLLYGVTKNGGNADNGVLYSFNTTTNSYTPLVNMSTIGANDTWGGFIEDPNGTLVGMTNLGGLGLAGTMFKYVIGTNTLSTLVNFAYAEASFPKGRLTRATNGLFYGLASGGGLNGQGVLFSFNPTGSVFTKLVDLGGALGGSPFGTLVLSGGKLYGLCNNGGTHGGGTLFEFDPVSNTYTKKIDLQSAATGTGPLAGLMAASNGKLYGTTSSGATNGFGALLEYTPSTNTIVRRYDFIVVNGTQPEVDLLQASNGLLYGTLAQNGSLGQGTLFSYNPVNQAFTKLFNFDGLQGGTPSGELVQASNGKLYGTCRDGGLFFNGCIYSWDITSGTFVEEYDMETAEGRFSDGGLLEGTDARLYGTCVQGGANDKGVVFRFNPANGTFTVLQSFAGADGQNPFNSLVRDVIPPANQVQLAMKVFLEGPFNSGAGTMSDALRTLGGASPFPITEPYTALGFVHVGGGGGETISPTVLSVVGNDAIVDWVFLQLRSTVSPFNVIATRSALVQRDGDVVDINGVSAVSFNVAPGNYRVAVRHRNHLGCMTNAEVALSSSPTTVNLTNGSVATFGTSAQKTVGAFQVLFAGNCIPDNILKYSGSSNDRDPILVRIGGAVPTNTTNGYYIEDVNLDGIVKYSGSSNDRDPILVNIGGSVPTATRTEQLP
ncbi:MAG: hypothetical protein JNM31_13535 [Flavobacteriales bacterium]|nr:hypothetical protein [Flavobacteriales bacterium]